jgi:hypothetical protein
LKSFQDRIEVDPKDTLGFKNMAAPFAINPFSPRVETDPVNEVYPVFSLSSDSSVNGVSFRSLSDWPKWEGTPANYDKLHFSSMDLIADVKKAFETKLAKKKQCEKHLDYCTECGGIACTQECGAFAMGDPEAPCTCRLEAAPFPIEHRENDDYAPPPSLCRSLSHTESAEQDAWPFMLECKEGEHILYNYWISETIATFNFLVREGNVFYREAFEIRKSADVEHMPAFHYNYTHVIQKEVAEFVALKKQTEENAKA